MTWREISIRDKSYLIKYVMENNDQISFYASDFEILWSEKCSVVDVLTRAREQNKRIEYGNDVILTTLAGTPTDAKLDCVDESGKLELRYVVNDKPLKFRWFLKRCSQGEYMDILLTPLLLSTWSLSKQNAELIDVIKKKDIEIEQYKLEGATLKRYKLITEKFDETEFKRKINFKPVDEFIEFTNKKYKNFIQQYNTYNQVAGSSHESSPEKKFRDVTKSSPKGKKSHYRSHILNIKHKQLDTLTSKLTFDDSDSSCTPSASENETKEFEFIKNESYNVPESSQAKQTSAVANKKIRLSQKKLNL